MHGRILKITKTLIMFAGVLACSLPLNTDTAPNPCPTAAGGK